MELNKSKWTKNDIKEFQDYLNSFEKIENKEWAKNLIKTNLPLIYLTSSTMKDIVNKIYKGNYLSFLDLNICEYYENVAINGYLINKIKDFDIYIKYLDLYSSKIDNWATCDLLKFNIKNKEEEFFSLATAYSKNDKPFVRRIGMYILFEYIDKEEYIDKIYKILNNFYNEKEYYVNMMNAWLLSECFIKQKDKTLKFLEKNKLNKFTINKGIQKCRESKRVSIEDKDMLLKYKIKEYYEKK